MIRCGHLSSTVLLPIILLFACRADTSSNTPITVRDSAGIEIVESAEPMLSSVSWTVSPEPVVQIGEVEGDERYMFLGIPPGGRVNPGGVFGLSDVGIVVCESGDRTVRIYDWNGLFVRQFGRAGEGPGEFRADIGGCIPSHSRITVLERTGASLFDAEGRFLEKIRLEVPNGFMPYGMYPDGSLLVLTASDAYQQSRSLGLQIVTANVLLQMPDGNASDWLLSVNLSSLITSEIPDGRRIVGPQNFGPSGVVVPTRDGFLYGWSESYELRQFGKDGALNRVIRQTLDPVPLTDKDREDGLEPIPERYAAFDRVVVDRLDHLWVHRLYPGDTWDVFDPSGQWVTTLALPEDFMVHDIGEDYVLGVWRDELRVQNVRMYSLDRSG